MDKRKILVQLDGDPHASVFDRVVAVDAEADEIFSYGGVKPEDVQNLVHGCIFTRGPKDLKRTALFIGGSDVAAAEKLLHEALKHMLPGFGLRVSAYEFRLDLFADALARAEVFIKAFRGDSLIVPAVAPHAMYTLDRATLVACAALGRRYDVPVLIHLAETEDEVKTARTEHQATPTGYLESIGFFGPKTLAAHGVNIISAQIGTRGDGIAIDTFQVNDPTGEAITSHTQWSRTLEALRAVLSEEQSVDALLDRRRQRLAHPPVAAPAPPKITVSNQLSDTDTVVEVKCPDRVGLLYQITRTLSSLGLDITSARIATEIDQAFDTFYVHDHSGMKLVEPDETARARGALEQALLQPI